MDKFSQYLDTWFCRQVCANGCRRRWQPQYPRRFSNETRLRINRRAQFRAGTLSTNYFPNACHCVRFLYRIADQSRVRFFPAVAKCYRPDEVSSIECRFYPAVPTFRKWFFDFGLRFRRVQIGNHACRFERWQYYRFRVLRRVECDCDHPRSDRFHGLQPQLCRLYIQNNDRCPYALNRLRCCIADEESRPFLALFRPDLKNRSIRHFQVRLCIEFPE